MKKKKDAKVMIKIENLSIKKSNSFIIRNISAEIKRGDLLYIIGPNGGGKTTFIKAILGLEEYQGKIKVFGKDREELSIKELKNIGYVPQIKNVNFEFPITVEEVVNYMREHKEEDIKKLLKKFGIYGIRGKILNELSGGQLQRVFISRALVDDPEIIIFDEPDTALDSSWRSVLYSTINELKARGKTLLIVTHDLTIMNEAKSKVLCLNKTTHLHGTKDEIITKDNLESVYGCPVELIAHGKIPHRVLERHKNE